jgi:dTDP-4-dehydrorhamnose reductase
MNDSEIFIVGANGQLGTALRVKYPGAKSADVDELDITKKSSVLGYDWSGIKYLLNAAAYTNVDGAETDEGRIAAWNVNALAVGYLTQVAADHDITIAHISTDYVFDGSKEMHTEEEEFSPLSVYGASKAAGDIVVALAPKHYILRTSTLELVSAIDLLISKTPHYGTYNVSNGGEPASWADITRAIFEEAGHSELTVTDTTTEKYFAGKENIAPRPLMSTLDLTKVEKIGFKANDWRASLKSYIQKEKENS